MRMPPLVKGAMAASDGQLVDELRGESAADFGGAKALGRRCDLNGADEFGVFFFEIENGDVRAEGGEHIEQRGAGGIEADGVKNQAGAGEERGGAEEKCCRGKIAGDGCIDGVERLRAGDGDGAGCAGERCAEGAEGQLAVVAGADFFEDGCGSGGLQSGEENAALDLRAGNGRGVVDGAKRAAVDGERRVSVSEREARAHGFERFANALHGAAREGFVADESEAAGLRREKPGDHAHGRAGVAAVERMSGGSDAAGDAGDFDGVCAGSIYLCAERLHAGEGGGAVRAGGEIGEARSALSEAAEHGVAMADGFVAGQAKAADDVSSGTDEAFLCGYGQDGSGGDRFLDSL